MSAHRALLALLAIPVLVMAQEKPSTTDSTAGGAQQEPAQTGISGPIPGLNIRGYGDVQYNAGTKRTSKFVLGDFSLFLTSQLSDSVRVLADIVFETDVGDEVGLDIGRLVLLYSPSDYFNIGIGRLGTAIGYYNTAYYEAGWFQTSVDRPFLFAFEKEGGILPLQGVGVTLSGRIPSGALGLRYLAELNSDKADDEQGFHPNAGKAVNFGIQARPDRWPGLQLGCSVYRNRFRPPEGSPVTESIYAAHAVYIRSGWEILNEGVLIRNAVRGGAVFRTPGFYSQIARRFRNFQPYLRYQYINTRTEEPIFDDLGRRNGPSVGVRYRLGESAAFKLQLDREARRLEKTQHGLKAQLVFRF